MPNVARIEQITAASKVFSPSAPIDQWELFAGRMEQTKDLVMSLNQKGQHVILYGERGVGKTSLSNVIQLLFDRGSSSDMTFVNVNCDPTDNFSSIWHKAFRQMTAIERRTGLGFGRTETTVERSMNTFLPQNVTPDDIRYALVELPKPVIFILDEVDTIVDKSATQLMAHTIKSLSDYAVRSKIVLVAVADTVEELIEEHRSVERSLIQVRMPRMSRSELFELLDKALSKINITIEKQAKHVIAQLSHGLPHYTHSMGLHATIKAIEAGSSVISLAHVYEATANTIQKSSRNNRTIASSFDKATRGTKVNNLHAKVLLSCALAETDGLGTFSASDIREPLSKIAGKPYSIGAYQRHLDDFSCEKRGPVLRKLGSRGMYRYRFVNPMLPPFAVIQGIRDKALKDEALEEFVLNRSTTDEPPQLY